MTGTTDLPSATTQIQALERIVAAREFADLTVRQLTIMLIVPTIEPGDRTVRGLAARLSVSKPAISRAADRLTELGMMHRAADKRDGRSVLLMPTEQGHLLAQRFAGSAA